MLDKRTRLAYFNDFVLPHLDYADAIWRDQPGLESEMQLQAFKIAGGKLSSAEILVSLKWFPLYVRRFGHRGPIAQNVVKGDIPEHLKVLVGPL